jgi:serine acetyltransferase
VVRLINFLIFKAAIPPQAVLGKRITIAHQGVGLVVHPHVTVGDDVRLFHGVTLGTTVPLSDPARIMIGDRVTIYPNCVIVGPRTIGSDAIIGAGSIVTKDIPAGAVAFGNPARVHRMRSEEELTAFRARFALDQSYLK